MGGLQYGEGSTKFILEGADGFKSYYTRDLCYGVFLASSISYAQLLGDLDDILASSLMEM
jgi:hypothetical protein